MGFRDSLRMTAALTAVCLILKVRTLKVFEIESYIELKKKKIALESLD